MEKAAASRSSTQPSYAARVLSGQEGYLPLAVWPCLVLVVVWFAVGWGNRSWDVESLVPGLGWIFVAQVSVLAHIRRTGSGIPGSSEFREERKAHPSVACRRIGAAAMLVVLAVWASLGTLTIPVMAVLLGLLLCWLGVMALWAWRSSRGAGSFPWASIALALLGATSIVWVHPIPSVSAFVTMSLIVCAIGIWVVVVVRDVLEIAG